MADRIAVGVIRKAHGVRGEASVELLTDSADRFLELYEVQLVSPDEKEIRPATIESVRSHLGRALVKFTGLDAPEDGTVYWPFVDFPNAFFVLRTTADPASQSAAVRQLLSEQGYTAVQSWHDLAGIARVTGGRHGSQG